MRDAARTQGEGHGGAKHLVEVLLGHLGVMMQAEVAGLQVRAAGEGACEEARAHGTPRHNADAQLPRQGYHILL